MGDLLRYHSKEQLELLDNIEMLRLLYLFEIVAYVRKLDETGVEQLDTILKDVPLVTDAHYRYIVENLLLPEEVIGKN